MRTKVRQDKEVAIGRETVARIGGSLIGWFLRNK
jgi:hypothetical protein